MQDTPFPALRNSEMYTEAERLRSEQVMKRECRHLLDELKRLETSRVKYESKVKNALDLVSSFYVAVKSDLTVLFC